MIHRSRFVHHMQVLSPDFSRYLSHSIRVLLDAQGQNDSHAACAAELPGICDVNLVSHTMGDGISLSAWSRGICKRENPTQGCTCPRTVPHAGGEIRYQRRAQRAKRTGVLMADASHSMDKPAPQSVSQWVPPFTHTSSLPSARTLPANAAVLFS